MFHNRRFQDVIGRNKIFILLPRLEFILCVLVATFRHLEALDRFTAEGVDKYEGVPEKICGNTFDRNEGSRST